MKKSVENIVGKGENAGYAAFSPFPTMFTTLLRREIVILATVDLSSAYALDLVKS